MWPFSSHGPGIAACPLLAIGRDRSPSEWLFQRQKQLRRRVPTIRIHNKYTQPDLATDMLEVDMAKLGLLWQRGRDSARDVEADLKKLLL